MTETTTLGTRPLAGEKEASQAGAVPSRETEPGRELQAQILVRYPRLPAQIVRVRGQKICSYCKHAIDEDPYFPYRGYLQRALQNRSYALRYLVLECAQWTGVMFYFIPKLRAYLHNLKQRVLLPGWVRCANPDCKQLYHASCWYQIKHSKGCLRCHAQAAHRVV